MPTNKDLKRLVRSRMAKTGESYTAARQQVVVKATALPPSTAETPPEAASVRPTPASAHETLAGLAGVRDEVIVERTGRSWRDWVELLEPLGPEPSHRELVARVDAAGGLSHWWAQTVAVGYERIKGLREIGQRRSGSYETNKSKVFSVPLTRLYRAFVDEGERRLWLADTEVEVRTATADRSLRWTVPDGSLVQLWFVAKGATKSQVQLQHGKLASRDEAEALKRYWAERFDALGELLRKRPRGTP